MKVFFAPDTSDSMNWGCRLMGEWFHDRFSRAGVSASGIASGWFYRQHPELPQLRSLADFQHYAAQVAAGTILASIGQALKRCDTVLLNGENFIRPGTHKGRMLLFLAYLAKVVYGKTCILTNHSVELDDAELAEIVAHLYPLLDGVHFREDTSWELAAHLVKPENRALVPDVAWTFPAAPLADWVELASRPGHFSAWPDSARNFNPAQPYVTVCASSVFSMPGKQPANAVPGFSMLCKRLQQEVAPVLLTAPCEVDQNIMRQVSAQTNTPLLGNHLPVRHAVDVIGNAAVHVGGRWHLGIFAATGGTPLVAMGANSHKMHSLLRQLELDQPVYDALALEQHIDAIVAEARQHVGAGDPLRHQIQRRSQELGKQVDDYWRQAITSLN